MFGVGVTEMVIVGILFLVIFGPGKLPQMARDIGRFVGEARGLVDEFKSELASGEGRDEGSGRKDRKPEGERGAESGKIRDSEEDRNPGQDPKP